MRALQTSKFLIIGFLIIACIGGNAQERTVTTLSSAVSGTARARDLLEQNVQVTSIAGGTTVGEALDKILIPIGAWTTTVAGRRVNCVNWSAAPGAELVPLPPTDLTGVKVKDALTKIADAADAVYSTNFSGSGASVFITISRKPSKDMNRLVYFAFPGWPLESVLKTMLEGTNTNYVISPGISNITVNATLKGVSLDTAIGAVMKAVGADFYKEDNVIYVMPTATQNQAMANQRLQQASPGRSMQPREAAAKSAVQQQKVISQAVDLKYLGAGDIAPIVTRPGMNVMSTNRNAAVITGPEQEVKEATTLIQKLDNEQSLPRPIRIKITLKAIQELGANQQPNVCTFEAEKVAAEGSLTNLSIVGADRVVPSANLAASLTPSVSNDGRISLVGGIGRIDCRPTAQTALTMFVGDFAVSLRPGEEKTLATTVSGYTGRSLRGELVISAKIEDGAVSGTGRSIDRKTKSSAPTPAPTRRR